MTLVHGSRLAGLVTAALATAAGLVGLSSAPVSAAVCSSAGITAVVDASGAGGGVQSACVRGTVAKKALAVFSAVGDSVERNGDGSVCQVNGMPSNATCHGLGNQYWALFWSNGTNGKWVYSQQGDASLSIPKNGSVAWAWQSTSSKREPGVAPPVVKVTPTPKPTPKPAPKPTKIPNPTKAPTTPRPTKKATATTATKAPATAGATVGASARSSAKAAATTSASATSGSPSTSATTELPATDQASPAVTSAQKMSNSFKPDDEHSGLPAWVPVGVIVVLGGAAGGAVWWRRRTGAA